MNIKSVQKAEETRVKQAMTGLLLSAQEFKSLQDKGELTDGAVLYFPVHQYDQDVHAAKDDGDNLFNVDASETFAPVQVNGDSAIILTQAGGRYKPSFRFKQAPIARVNERNRALGLTD